MKNIILIALSLILTPTFAQKPTVEAAKKEVESKNFIQAVANKFKTDKSSIKVSNSDVGFNKSSVAVQNSWGDDRALVSFTYTTAKDGNGIWYEQTAIVMFAKSSCSIPGKLNTCYLLDNWILKEAYLTTYKTLGAKEVTDDQLLSAVEDYLEKSTDEIGDKVSDKFENIIQFNPMSIWDRKDDPSPNEKIVAIEITGVLGHFSAARGEIQSVSEFTTRPTVYFKKSDGNNWVVTSIGGMSFNFSGLEHDSKYYSTYASSGYYALKNKKVEIPIPVESCKSMTTEMKLFFDTYRKQVSGEKASFINFFEDQTGIKKSVELITYLISNGYELKIEEEIHTKCDPDQLNKQGCYGYFSIYITHPKAKSKLVKELEEYDAIKNASKILSGKSAYISIEIRAYIKDNKWFLLMN